MDKQEKIIEFCKAINLDLVGFIKCREFSELKEFYSERKELKLENEFEEADILKRINPKTYMEDGKTIISIAFPYNTGEKLCDNGFSIYTKGMDYHNVVHKYLENICEFIKSLGGECVAFTDSNCLPERHIAALAGVGFIGKNNMLITEKYGSYVFLGEIITDLEVYNEDKTTFHNIREYSKCGECNICFNECPSKSINSFRRNPNICVSYLTQKKELNDKEINLINGRIFGCDSCQMKCPYNENSSFTNLKEFEVKDFMKNDDEDFIININNSLFKETFKITSCGWRGKNTLIRNAMIRKKKFKNKELGNIKSESPYIKEYIKMLSKENS
ncbi:tRNA epoxyqueuosine(34) reductase QueG [Clostridium baratii]|uniref:tRNA epoxyqueuosine(34) reductase QueG n=1 Tax=Clostridium baratii TaxID=1561 RepID=UPI001C0306D0|nr:tRNA epoxyqueuosine(34) reductase QueG [Clostridium baratii]MBT9832228.1 tRNA epoxyqueuosine(34) reductase QueG [Clostridium baratii]